MKSIFSALLLFLSVSMTLTAQPAHELRTLPDDLEKQDLVFIYVHGFAENKDVVPFEANMRDYLKPLPVKAAVVTFRYDRIKINPRQLVHQWTTAKEHADAAAVDLNRELLKLEQKNIRYVLVGYSLGSRVVAGALQQPGEPLRHVQGIYFLGSALPKDFQLQTNRLPEKMKIRGYYSSAFDQVLKHCFFNAEGIKAAGEAGFNDMDHFTNYRTTCTHVHKGGLCQRDYASLAPAIGALALFEAKLDIPVASTAANVATPVMDGGVNWHDIVLLETITGPVLIQQNANTGHYRAVSEKDGQRRRQAWGGNLYALLRQL